MATPSDCEALRNGQAFLGAHHARNERSTRVVIGLTIVMMVAEIAGGTYYGSMALVADGWHMATHAGALTIAALAYRYATRHANDPRFSFGTGKLGDLAGFASAVALGLIAILIGWESTQRLLAPVPIDFTEATLVAAVGLVVNLVSAWLLHHDHSHDPSAAHDHHHDDDHDHGHEHAPGADGHADHNLRAAYAHVLADALTSVLAIVGLLAGAIYGWIWMDALMGILGAIVIARWSIGLVRDAGAVLLDANADPRMLAQLRAAIEQEGTRIVDLHVWRIGPGHYSAAVSLVAADPRPAIEYRRRLEQIPGLSHVTVEARRLAA